MPRGYNHGKHAAFIRKLEDVNEAKAYLISVFEEKDPLYLSLGLRYRIKNACEKVIEAFDQYEKRPKCDRCNCVLSTLNTTEPEKIKKKRFW